MASLHFDETAGIYRIAFRFGNRQFKRSLKTGDQTEARARLARLEETIRLVEGGRIQVPHDADIATFLLSDGKLPNKIQPKQSLRLSVLFSEFFENLPDQNLEETTLYGMKIHRRHLERILGKKFVVQYLTLNDLQKYVNKRAKEKGKRGGTVGANTINKELVTFRTVWGWGGETGRLEGIFPRKGIRLPKAKEMPIFQTWNQIERQVTPQMKENQRADLWDCLYLTMPEIEQLLKDVNRYASFPFIHPMFSFAAYTGARRSEIIRSQINDIDFESQVITIREKKRVRGQLSTRRVPLTPPLQKTLKAWLKVHPGGQSTFCHATHVERSKTERSEPVPLTGDEAHHHFKQTIKDSKWEVVHGWHVFRHSFVSNCASKGIDQRMIDEWVGHSTEAMRRRYRHLFPSSQRDAMELLFC